MRVIARLSRVASLILFAAVGTILLMRFSPGYFTDSREMDAQYADGARTALRSQEQTQRSVAALTLGLIRGWQHGDFGRSRQFDVPVGELIRPRIRVTANLLFAGIVSGWLFALCLALPISARQTSSGEGLIAAPTALLLAVPIGVMATVCLLANKGGPVLVLTTLIAVRDFKFVYRLLRQAWSAPYLLFARAQGIAGYRILWAHLVPNVAREAFSLGVMSFVVALSALVPVEVVFDVPGLGQLAWAAAMNRDLPVLLPVTMLMAMAVGLTTLATPSAQRLELV